MPCGGSEAATVYATCQALVVVIVGAFFLLLLLLWLSIGLLVGLQSLTLESGLGFDSGSGSHSHSLSVQFGFWLWFLFRTIAKLADFAK